MTYAIKITEVSHTIVDIEANSPKEALKLAQEEYWKDPNDYVLEPFETDFELA